MKTYEFLYMMIIIIICFLANVLVSKFIQDDYNMKIHNLELKLDSIQEYNTIQNNCNHE